MTNLRSRNVTKRAVDALRCPAERDRVFLWDESLSGFGVAAYPSGKKVYVAQYRQNGRSRRMSLGEHGRITPDEARSMAKKVLGSVEDGKDPIEERRTARGVRTFKAVAEEFMQVHVRKKRKARTATEYDSLLRNHLLPSFGSKQITAIRRQEAIRFHAGLTDSPGAANRALALLSSIWSWAAKNDEVSAHQNPAHGIERNPENGRERYLSNDELARLGSALHLAETKGLPWDVDETSPTAKHIPKKRRSRKLDPHAIGAIRLLILTGARLREILDAKWEWIDWERGLLLLPDSKTGKKTIYLSAPALEVLNGLPRVDGNPYVIPGVGPRKSQSKEAKRKPAPRADLKKPWEAISSAAGLESVRLHDLRHSFAARGAGASLGLPMIGKLLGHTQAQTTQRYAHLDSDPMHRAANLIGNEIMGAMTGEKRRNVVPIRS